MTTTVRNGYVKRHAWAPLLLAMTILLSNAPQAHAIRSSNLNLCDADSIVIAQVSDSRTRRVLSVPEWRTDATLTVLSIAQGPPVIELSLTSGGGMIDGTYQVVEHSPLLVHHFRYLLFVFERDDRHEQADGTRWYIADFLYLPEYVPVPDEIPLREFWLSACISRANKVYSPFDVLETEHTLLLPASLDPFFALLAAEYQKRSRGARPPSSNQIAEALEKSGRTPTPAQQPPPDANSDEAAVDGSSKSPAE